MLCLWWLQEICQITPNYLELKLNFTYLSKCVVWTNLGLPWATFCCGEKLMNNKGSQGGAPVTAKAMSQIPRDFLVNVFLFWSSVVWPCISRSPGLTQGSRRFDLWRSIEMRLRLQANGVLWQNVAKSCNKIMGCFISRISLPIGYSMLFHWGILVGS